MALTIGAVASGDTVPGVIIFIIGLLIIPPVTKFLVRLLKGKLKIFSNKKSLCLKETGICVYSVKTKVKNFINSLDYLKLVC